MTDDLFFFDTNPDEEVQTKEVKKPKISLGQSRRNFKEEKLQKLKEKEDNLSSFLFGNFSSEKTPKDNKAGDSGGEDESSEESDEEEESSEEDENDEKESDSDEQSDAPKVDSAKADDDETSDADDKLLSGGEEESSSGDESDSDEDDSRNVMDLIPADEYSAAATDPKRGRKRKAAWHDAADSEVTVKDVAANYRRAPGQHGAKDTSTEQYSEAVKRKFKGIVGDPAWARLDRKTDGVEEDSDEEFFQETTDLFNKKSSSTRLGKDRLAFRRVTDINKESGREGTVIRSTEFHPTSTVSLVAGLSGTASIFQVDGKTNPKIQTVNFKDFPIKTARFSVSGEEVVVGSQHHPHFFVYDMMAGKINKIPIRKKIAGAFNTQLFELSPDGRLLALKGRFGAVHLLSANTKEYIASLKMNDECRSLAFSKSGTQLYTHGEGGEVYIWDINTRTCHHKFVDEGCISGSSLAVNSSYLAAGSSEGVVNLYSLANLKPGTGNPKPDKVILNLTTQINRLRFNPTGEILSMSSELKDNAVKLLHFPSMTVFQNFPGDQVLCRINSVDFSPAGGYLAIGNNKGRALLYRLKHYKDY